MSAKFTIKEIFSDHWDSFLLDYPNVRPIVDKEICKVIGCGAYRFVHFRCHSRFCNTCGTSYQSYRADCIALKLINCKHPHVVFTIAEELRILFRKDHSLLHVLFRSASLVMSDWFHSKNL